MTVAIIPAAGESRRMGRPKLLLAFGDTTVAGALVRTLRAGGVDRIVVVIAPGDEALRQWAAGLEGVAVAENPEPQRGMLSSIVCGLDALGGAEAIATSGEPLLVTPADLPAMAPETIRGLIAVLRVSDTTLVVPVYRGTRGHPLGIGASLVVEVPALDATIGLRQLLDRHPVVEVAVDDLGVVADVDTPADYERLRAAHTRAAT